MIEANPSPSQADRSLQIRRVDQASSTNDLARAAIEAGDLAGPAVWVARQQSAARSRQGRDWVADEGGLWLSGAWPVESEPGLSVCLGAAITETLATELEPYGLGIDRVRLKWPNDVLVDGAKVCGILCETANEPNGRHWLVVGVGVNVNNETERLSSLLGRHVTSLALLAGREVEVACLEGRVIAAIEGVIRTRVSIESMQRAASLLFGLDQAVEVKHADGSTEPGTLRGLSADGAPVIEGKERRGTLPIGVSLTYPGRL